MMDLKLGAALFDICCIGVLNASTLATEGRFYGLLPFEAFTGKYIGTTLVLFFLALLGIFGAVSSYIFDRESGFGFGIGKNENGYASIDFSIVRSSFEKERRLIIG